MQSCVYASVECVYLYFSRNVYYVCSNVNLLVLSSTQADYTHLLKRLSHNFFKKFKSFNSTVSTSPGIWDLKDSVRSEITEIVSKIMSQCTIYSEELDNELGLCVPES